jgi:hypothetical protein
MSAVHNAGGFSSEIKNFKVPKTPQIHSFLVCFKEKQPLLVYIFMKSAGVPVKFLFNQKSSFSPLVNPTKSTPLG